MSAQQQQQGIGTLAYPYYRVMSSDEKPRPDGPDATLFEVDTRREFVWAAGQWWFFRELAGPAQGDDIQTSILSELRKIRSFLEVFAGPISDPEGDHV